MTTPRLLIHVGAPKTGTSYLQAVLWANQGQLEEAGILVPGKRQRFHYAAGTDLLGPDAVDFADRSRRSGPKGGWERMARAIHRSDAATVMITDERLAGADARAIKMVTAAAEDREVHVVYTARDLARVIPSAWQTEVKHGSTVPYRDWISRAMAAERSGPKAPWLWKTHNVPDVLERWAKVAAGAAAIHLVTVPPQGSPAMELWDRFATVLGVAGIVPEPTTRRNDALDYSQVEVLRLVNERITDDMSPSVHRRNVRNVLGTQVMGELATGHNTTLPPEYLPTVVEHSKAMIDELATSGIDVVGDLAELVPKGDQPEFREPDPDIIAQAAVAALAGMVTRVAQRS